MDIEQPGVLEHYLRATGRVAEGEPLDVRRLTGGVSNRTMLVQRSAGECWVVKQALPKLRVEVDWFSDPARIGREALGLRRLAELAPAGAITPLVFEDPAEHLLAMQAVPQPHENWKSLLLAGQVVEAHVAQFGALLGTIHRRGHEQRNSLAAEFADRTFFESLRLEPYYAYTATQVPAARGVLQRLIDDTLVRRDTLVHGDYSPKNVLVRDDRLVLLDHEVIHFGDGAFDLGFALAHLLSKARHVDGRCDDFRRAARTFWREYLAALGDVPFCAGLEPRAVRHALACLLARAAGRSPLEYLSPAERAAQQARAIELLLAPPTSIDVLDGACTADL
jgi:aminoglycoside phosphotransferase (APT) family kinase protein